MFSDEVFSGVDSLNSAVASGLLYDVHLDVGDLFDFSKFEKSNAGPQQTVGTTGSTIEDGNAMTPDSVISGAPSGTDAPETQPPLFVAIDLDGKTAYHCIPCGKTIKRKADLNRHLRTSLKHAGPQFSCPTCGKSFTRKHVLVGHPCTAGAAVNIVSKNGV
ncbi:hypothetical protein AX15_006691 [Amanita polypyramis BW_CC]|nr:hypothetical protein AX15_006691 [Amanita polypyramis BW_CC]